MLNLFCRWQQYFCTCCCNIHWSTSFWLHIFLNFWQYEWTNTNPTIFLFWCYAMVLVAFLSICTQFWILYHQHIIPSTSFVGSREIFVLPVFLEWILQFCADVLIIQTMFGLLHISIRWKLEVCPFKTAQSIYRYWSLS